MIVDTIKQRMMQALKDKNEVEKNILRVVLGEVQSLQPNQVNDERVYGLIRKIIKSNEETISYGGGRVEILKQENTILNGLLPELWNEERISKFLTHETILNAENEGKAIGLAIKELKKVNAPVSGETVKKVVLDIRASEKTLTDRMVEATVKSVELIKKYGSKEDVEKAEEIMLKYGIDKK